MPFDGTESAEASALKIIAALEDFIANNPPKWKQWKEKAKVPQ